MQKLWDEYRESLSLIDRHMENSNPDQEGEGTSHEQSRCLDTAGWVYLSLAVSWAKKSKQPDPGRDIEIESLTSINEKGITDDAIQFSPVWESFNEIRNHTAYV